MTEQPVVLSDDTDASWTFNVEDPDGNDLTFEPTVAIGAGAYDITASWLGTVGPTRRLRVPLTGLEPGNHAVYLHVPGGNDVRLGAVHVHRRQ